MDNQITLSLPIIIHIDRKTYRLNRNQFDNLNWRVRHKIKNAFFSHIRTWYVNYLLKSNVVLTPPLRLRYKLFMQTRRRVDPANFIDIVNKMFCDTLTPEEVNWRRDRGSGRIVSVVKPGLGLIPDDSHKYISREDDPEIEIDRHNPRVEVTVTSVGKEEPDGPGSSDARK